jgi:hypothetical protein
MVCWQKDRDPLKSLKGKEINLFVSPYPSTPPPYQFTKGRATDLERPVGDYLGGPGPVKDIDLPLP